MLGCGDSDCTPPCALFSVGKQSWVGCATSDFLRQPPALRCGLRCHPIVSAEVSSVGMVPSCASPQVAKCLGTAHAHTEVCVCVRAYLCDGLWSRDFKVKGRAGLFESQHMSISLACISMYLLHLPSWPTDYWSATNVEPHGYLLHRWRRQDGVWRRVVWLVASW